VAIQTGSTYISDSATDIIIIPTTNLEFSTTPSAKKLTRAIATTDNRKLQYGHFVRQYCNFWQSVIVAIIWLIFSRARHHQKSRIWRWNFDAICQSSRDVIISGFGAISMFPVVGRCCTYLPTLFYTYTWSYTPDLSLDF